LLRLAIFFDLSVAFFAQKEVSMFVQRISIMRRIGPIVLVVFFLTGCASSPLVQQLQQIAIENQKALASLRQGNRLLVLDINGNIYTMDQDGSNWLPITDDASALRQYLQPTWSPDGQQIAWAQVDISSETTRSALVTSRFDGNERNAIEVPFTPFYIFWSPVGERLAYLSNWISNNQQTLALRLIDLAADTDQDITLAEGQPFYFSWSPDGQRMLTHVSNERLAFQSLDGSQEWVSDTVASFPAPQWSANSEHLIYAVDDPSGQRLIVADLLGNELNEVTDFDDRITFTQSPNSQRIAYVITSEPISLAAFGPLYVFDAESQRTRELTDRPVIAFFWSPDGEKLAYLVAEEIAESLWLRWYVWNGERTQGYDTIVPSRTFLQRYLAFFDQYAQSMNIWSPDSTAFAYAGVDQAGRRGVWVQEVGEGKEPTLVSRGVFVAWSPK
jgi:TolB protein